MTPTIQRSRALCAALLLLSSVSCGPKVVVARLATPTAVRSARDDAFELGAAYRIQIQKDVSDVPIGY